VATKSNKGGKDQYLFEANRYNLEFCVIRWFALQFKTLSLTVQTLRESSFPPSAPNV